MTDLPPRQRKARPAPAEPPLGSVAATPVETTQSAHPATFPVPNDLEWSRTKTTRMTSDHEQLLNELKYRHGLKIQEAIWYALENTYRNK